jgi:hypothetical protein
MARDLTFARTGATPCITAPSRSGRKRYDQHVVAKVIIRADARRRLGKKHLASGPHVPRTARVAARSGPQRTQIASTDIPPLLLRPQLTDTANVDSGAVLRNVPGAHRFTTPSISDCGRSPDAVRGGAERPDGHESNHTRSSSVGISAPVSHGELRIRLDQHSIGLEVIVQSLQLVARGGCAFAYALRHSSIVSSPVSVNHPDRPPRRFVVRLVCRHFDGRLRIVRS